MFKFPKKQKLCSETVIKEMFSSGKSFKTSALRLVWKEDNGKDEVAIKSIIVVPKKKIRLAVKRNIINQNEYDDIWESNVIQWLCGDDEAAKQKLINRILK